LNHDLSSLTSRPQKQPAYDNGTTYLTVLIVPLWKIYNKKRHFKILNSRNVHYNKIMYYVILLHFHLHDSNINQIFHNVIAFIFRRLSKITWRIWCRYATNIMTAISFITEWLLKCSKCCLYTSRFSGLARVSRVFSVLSKLT